MPVRVALVAFAAVVLSLGGWLLMRPAPSDAHIVSGEYSLEADAPDSPVAVNDEFTVLLGVFHETSGYRAVQWHLDYDESVVEVTSMSPAPGAPPDCVYESDDGSRVLTACLTPLLAEGLTHSGPAWAIGMRCVGEGSASLNLIKGTDDDPRSFVAKGLPSTNQPSHVHSDTVACSSSAPTNTPAPSPTPVPVLTATGDTYHLSASGPSLSDVGDSFTVQLSVESLGSSPYRGVQWGLHFDSSLVDIQDVSQVPNALAGCVSVPSVEWLFASCLTDVPNGYSYQGPVFEVTFTCLATGIAVLDLTNPTEVQPSSKVTSGEVGNWFDEQVVTHDDTVQCVEPLPFNGLVKGIDLNGDTDVDDAGETPAEGEDTLLHNLWLCVDIATDGIDNDGDSTVDDEPPSCDGIGEGSLEITEVLFAELDCDTRNDDDDDDGYAVDGSVATGALTPYEGDDPRPECPQPRLEDFLLDNVDKDGGELPEGLGAIEFQLKFDHKVFDIAVEPLDGWLDAAADGFDNDGDTVVDNEPARFGNCNMTIVTENDIRFGCVSTGGTNGIWRPFGVEVARVTVLPESDLIFRLRPTKDNGVVRRLLDEGCQVADIYGDIFPKTNAGLTPGCTDVDITVRRLEGDVNADCGVNIHDAQLIAFRYGSFFGHLIYAQTYDLEPWPTADFDIDIKDLQFVFGRSGSTCASPVPAQQWPVPAEGVGQP